MKTPTMTLLLLLSISLSSAFLPQAAVRRSPFLGASTSAAFQRKFTATRKPRTILHAEATTKTSEDEAFIKQSLLQNALFTGIPPPSLQRLVGAFERQTASKDDILIQQGDSCVDGCVYLLAEGNCRVLVNNVIVPEPYGRVDPPALFGELGILYEKERAATIVANSENVVYYEVSGDGFKAAVDSTSQSNEGGLDLDKMKEIDEAINQVQGTNALYGGDIIPQYQPERVWLWQQYAGTILKISLNTTLLSMLACAIFVLCVKELTDQPLDFHSWQYVAPDKTQPLVQILALIFAIWNIQKALVTFVLTFYVSKAYSFWKDIYETSRRMMGKIAGFNMLLATNVYRNDDGTLPMEAEQFLSEVGQYSRLFHILMWAGRAKRFSSLCTTEGLRRMESRGLMTDEQLGILLNLDLPNDQLFTAPLEWMMIRTNQAISEGILMPDNATKSSILAEYRTLRDSYAAIGGKISGRMPLAYVHFVQILVDGFVFISPLALYPDLGEYSILACGLITLFYSGMNNLAKIFLDPLNNESFCENAIYMDLGVLIREANGGSTLWKKSGMQVPFGARPKTEVDH